MPLLHKANNQNVDAIVNAANKYLLAGGGICGAIFKKAGLATLTNACSEYARPLKDGEAVITPAFGITNAKYIIHAVGPDFNGNNEKEKIGYLIRHNATYGLGDIQWVKWLHNL